MNTSYCESKYIIASSSLAANYTLLVDTSYLTIWTPVHVCRKLALLIATDTSPLFRIPNHTMAWSKLSSTTTNSPPTTWHVQSSEWFGRLARRIQGLYCKINGMIKCVIPSQIRIHWLIIRILTDIAAIVGHGHEFAVGELLEPSA